MRETFRLRGQLLFYHGKILLGLPPPARGQRPFKETNAKTWRLPGFGSERVGPLGQGLGELENNFGGYINFVGPLRRFPVAPTDITTTICCCLQELVEGELPAAVLNEETPGGAKVKADALEIEVKLDDGSTAPLDLDKTGDS